MIHWVNKHPNVYNTLDNALGIMMTLISNNWNDTFKDTDHSSPCQNIIWLKQSKRCVDQEMRANSESWPEQKSRTINCQVRPSRLKWIINWGMPKAFLSSYFLSWWRKMLFTNLNIRTWLLCHSLKSQF